jgi:hypothetical protein
MTVITLPRPAAAPTPATAPDAPRCFAAPHAFGVLRAWRAWAARGRDEATTGFTLVRGADETLVLAADGLNASALAALGQHNHRRVNPQAAPATGLPSAADDPALSCALRSLDDWAIEVFLRTGAAVSGSLVVGLRHRAGRIELIAFARQDAAEARADLASLRAAMGPWIDR